MAKCEGCGCEYEKAVNNQRTCSKKCYYKLRKSEDTKKTESGECTCGNCGKSFEKQYTRHEYCSIECRRAASNKRRTKRAEKKPCKHCGELFKANSDSQVYCSIKCRAASKLIRPRKYVRKKTDYGEGACIVCGVTFKKKSPIQISCGSEHCKKKRKQISNKLTRKLSPSIPTECPYCGVTYGKKNRAATCGSNECKTKHATKLQRDKRERDAKRPPRPAKKKQLICKCGKPRAVGSTHCGECNKLLRQQKVQRITLRPVSELPKDEPKKAERNTFKATRHVVTYKTALERAREMGLV